ncbi:MULTISPECIES: phage antirepressor KilAC domain-containing protein [unclassified Streptococcus]|uniref:phage antirepressor KilAC domain-containing protein n=1 Tax=unclassified Streptococcus TaxID=2608887 RepID=UPI00211B52BC|nr:MULTISPECIES: phage antirepressor KilAC domain-containing protein [unclassified Streptococcus]MCQ9211847.1 phage antirepressor KilAC domain-containing protein [Streptococcus sp. B01]MCQ9212877.1 phage antirepressor KilAC domain-containing protein [Streptococcus sp. B01]MCQ9212968.1 phage antirepressor KilAC domain-containing protein [Streptococcus sp. O1]MCQ9214993.1 phage antirepressor KilAC domain-containing protein [Streptococcus sp. O1]
MNEIINVKLNDSQEPVVSGRQLHMALGVKTAYKDWFPRMVEYGFTESQDFNPLKIEQVRQEGIRQVKRQIDDHILKLDMAKEIAMIQRTEKGKQVRQYFIQIEKDFNSPEKIMARALLMADKKVHKLEAQIEADRPKVLFAEAVEASSTSILIGDFAKILRQNGYNIGQNRLFAWLRENGFLIRKKGESYNMPTQRSMDMKLFEVKERTHHEPNGSIRISRTTKITGREQTYFIEKFLNHNAVVV